MSNDDKVTVLPVVRVEGERAEPQSPVKRKIYSLPGAPVGIEYLLGQCLEQHRAGNVEAIVLIEIDKEGSCSVGWTDMPISRLCYANKSFDVYVNQRMQNAQDAAQDEDDGA